MGDHLFVKYVPFYQQKGNVNIVGSRVEYPRVARKLKWNGAKMWLGNSFLVLVLLHICLEEGIGQSQVVDMFELTVSKKIRINDIETGMSTVSPGNSRCSSKQKH